MVSTASPNVPSGPMVIFGGASGIGLATAVLASQWCEKVVIADLNAEGQDLDLVRSGKAEFHKCDATSAEAVDAMLQACISRLGALGSVVTAVGGSRLNDPLTVDLAAWRKEFSINLDSAYVVATTAANYMKAQGAGSIVTISSTIAATPRPDRIAYAAAKSGVIALTKGLALAVAGNGVRVNCVAPHSTDTPRFRALIGDAAALEARIEASPQKRISVPDDLAHTILFLTSEGARSITGQVIWVNNGCYMA